MRNDNFAKNKPTLNTALKNNIDNDVVNDFGQEWKTFDQSTIPDEELKNRFDEYFSIFPWDKLPIGACGFDLGCGSGRWDSLVAQRVGRLYCIDPAADALNVAKQKIKSNNVTFILAGVDNIPLEGCSMDFGYSLGVLHHVPDTGRGIASCVEKLKTGAPFLLYLYYAFDNRPLWFKFIWQCSNLLRIVISRLPNFLKFFFSQIIAVAVYWPLARLSHFMENQSGVNVSNYPLSYYRNCSFYTMRTDAYDRFCTRLERRFSRKQIQDMMENAGLTNIVFSDRAPYWCAVGYKA